LNLNFISESFTGLHRLSRFLSC